jgi:hypothetical protein
LLTYTYSYGIVSAMARKNTQSPESPESPREDLLEILTVATEGQLRALRALRRRYHRPAPAPGKAKSHIAVVEGILRAANGPLHISDIIAQAQHQYHLQLSRESLVSALTKKVLDHHTFCRVGRNTFDLLERQPP